MKFNIIICRKPTEVNVGEANDPRTTFEMEGDLDAVKTYLKLAMPVDFKWGAVERLDEMEQSDVSRWMICKNDTNGDVFLRVFSFHEVEPLINLNAAFSALSYDKVAESVALSKALGGGKF